MRKPAKHSDYVAKLEKLLAESTINKEQFILLKKIHEILEESGMTQEEFGKIIFETEKGYTNEIMNGKKNFSPLKQKIAINNILREFPYIRKEWLLGEDGYKTEEEKNFAQFFNVCSDLESRNEAFCVLARLCGYSFQSPNYFGSMTKDYPIFHEGKAIKRISRERFELLTLDILELTEQRIKSFLREGE